jgi:hypothetical protein
MIISLGPSSLTCGLRCYGGTSATFYMHNKRMLDANAEKEAHPDNDPKNTTLAIDACILRHSFVNILHVMIRLAAVLLRRSRRWPAID